MSYNCTVVRFQGQVWTSTDLPVVPIQNGDLVVPTKVFDFAYLDAFKGAVVTGLSRTTDAWVGGIIEGRVVLNLEVR